MPAIRDKQREERLWTAAKECMHMHVPQARDKKLSGRVDLPHIRGYVNASGFTYLSDAAAFNDDCEFVIEDSPSNIYDGNVGQGK